tara:strand:+ start:227 stop:541 length:315 start_codon:yes stop_codon:yes gene_type:complete
MGKALFLVLVLFMINIIFVLAEEDDDNDIIGEIIIDLFVGGTVEICSYYNTCNTIMTIFFSIVIISTCLGLCIGDTDPDEVCNARCIRRCGTVFVGRRIVRSYH